MSRKIYAAILGAGTVGTGVYKLCQSMKDDVISKTGAELVVKKVLVRNLHKDRAPIDRELLTDNWKDIIEDKDIEIVIELMGGTTPAKQYILEALEAGKQVVTANKDLLAEYGEEVMGMADKMHADLQFEAAVAGAIPIIRPLKQSMAGNNITEIIGIVNGTTNYILTKMTESGMNYKDALAKATELGYAEADPTADVEGYDAGRNAGDPRRQPAGEREAAEGIPVTGWEDQRNILLASFQGRGYAARVRQLYQMEDVHPRHHPGAVGIGAASVAAGMSLLEDSSDDPEERRRQMEAREAAQNLGAVIGLAAGAVGAAAGQRQKDTPKPDEPQMKQTLG